MNKPTKNLPLRASVRAVQSALAVLALSASAQAADVDPAVIELTTPANRIELGAGMVSSHSAKAAEFNGVREKGLFGSANVDLRGGGVYDSGDASQWRFSLRDLGLDRRGLSAQIGEQGRFRLDLGYDELLRNRSDTYQTPFLGVGTNRLTLPSTWLAPLVPRVSTVAPGASTAGGANARGLSPEVTGSNALISGVSTAPTAAQTATAAAIQAADLPLFHSVGLSTKRTRYGMALSVELDPRWQFTAGLMQEHRSGLKPMGTVTRYTNADLSAVITDLIDQDTGQLNLGLNYAGDKLTLSTAYHGSLFRNNVGSMTWANWAVPGNLQTMSSAPGNQVHQLSVNASYLLGRRTRLTGGLTYGRNTQDVAFLTDASTPLVPTTSLHGLVITRTANLKLVDRSVRQLTLSAAYKYDERDNRTPVNTYAYYDAGELKSGTSLFNAAFTGAGLGANANINANRPYSRRMHQLELDADHALGRGQALKAGAEVQQFDRYCTGSWVDCMDASNTREATLRAEWRLNAPEGLSARVALSAGRRNVDYNENAFLALVPAANLVPTGAPGGATAYATLVALGLTGYGPVAGLSPAAAAGSAQAFYFANNNALANALYGNQNRISELPGMRRYNLADRQRNKLRSTLGWQSGTAWSLQAGLDLNDDRYGDSVYGLKSARSWALNLDGSYVPGDDTSVTLFASFEDQRAVSAGNTYTANSTAANVSGFTAISGGCFATIALRNASNKVDPCLDWQADMRDKVATLGVSVSRKNLVGGALDLSGGLTFSQARSDIGVRGGNYVNNPLAVAGAPAGTVAAFYIPATAFPTIRTDTTELKLNARYALSKDRTLRIGYSWQHLKSVDWAYEGMQVGGLAGVLPSGEKAPTYNVHTLGIAYVYSFR